MKKVIATTIASLTLAALPAISACAIDSQSHDVTIGNVDETIYSVDINWGNLAFDWKYDEDNNDHYFQAQLGCMEVKGNSEYNGGFNGPDLQSFITQSSYVGLVYSDENCSNVYYGEIDGDTTYHMGVHAENFVSVLDYSTNGSVEAELSFSPESGYDWVVGKTAAVAALTTRGRINYYNSMSAVPEDELWPGMGVSGGPGPLIPWMGYFYVEAAPNTDTNAKTVTANDKIGTLTVNLTPAGD